MFLGAWGAQVENGLGAFLGELLQRAELLASVLRIASQLHIAGECSALHAHVQNVLLLFMGDDFEAAKFVDHRFAIGRDPVQERNLRAFTHAQKGGRNGAAKRLPFAPVAVPEVERLAVAQGAVPTDEQAAMVFELAAESFRQQRAIRCIDLVEHLAGRPRVRGIPLLLDEPCRDLELAVGAFAVDYVKFGGLLRCRGILCGNGAKDRKRRED